APHHFRTDSDSGQGDSFGSPQRRTDSERASARLEGRMAAAPSTCGSRARTSIRIAEHAAANPDRAALDVQVLGQLSRDKPLARGARGHTDPSLQLHNATYTSKLPRKYHRKPARTLATLHRRAKLSDPALVSPYALHRG